MIYQNFNIERYAWNVQVCYDVGEEDLNTVMNLLRHFYFNKVFNKACHDSIAKGELNTGFTCTNKLTRQTLICINKCSSLDEFINTVSHEIRHLESHIATVYNLDEKGEEVCYLIGEITEEMFDTFKKLL